MVRLNAAAGLVSVCMEGIQMSTDVLDWPKVLLRISIHVSNGCKFILSHLCYRSTCSENLVFRREWPAQALVGHRQVRLVEFSHHTLFGQLTLVIHLLLNL